MPTDRQTVANKPQAAFVQVEIQEWRWIAKGAHAIARCLLSSPMSASRVITFDVGPDGDDVFSELPGDDAMVTRIQAALRERWQREVDLITPITIPADSWGQSATARLQAVAAPDSPRSLRAVHAAALALCESLASDLGWAEVGPEDNQAIDVARRLDWVAVIEQNGRRVVLLKPAGKDRVAPNPYRIHDSGIAPC